MFSCNLAATLHFWQNDRDLVRATAVTDTEISETAQKVDPGEENSLAASAGTLTSDLSLTSLALYH